MIPLFMRWVNHIGFGLVLPIYSRTIAIVGEILGVFLIQCAFSIEKLFSANRFLSLWYRNDFVLSSIKMANWLAYFNSLSAITGYYWRQNVFSRPRNQSVCVWIVVLIEPQSERQCVFDQIGATALCNSSVARMEWHFCSMMNYFERIW